MKIEKHVVYSIEDFNNGRPDAALMHACLALEGTSRKLYGRRGKAYYKKCLRKYYWIIEFMLGGGINLEETIWLNSQVTDGYGKHIENPDLADIIYHIFRCSDAHGDSIPEQYSLNVSVDGSASWVIGRDEIHMPDRIVWALLAVCVFCETNLSIGTCSAHYLSWGSETLGIGTAIFPLKDWWGREQAFQQFVEHRPQTRITLDKLERLGRS